MEPANRSVAFTTLGCKVNQYDTEAMAAQFRQAGYHVVDFAAAADVYVINTCTVTGRAAAKSRQLIRGAIRRSPMSVVAVAGCYAQTDPDAVSAIPGVSLLVGNQDRHRLVELVEQALAAERPVRAVDNIWQTREFEEMPIDVFSEKSRAIVKVQEGCNIFCTFCIIPYARGKPRSRAPVEVLGEVERLAAAGYREVVLTGIHLGSYGKDVKGEWDLAELVADCTRVEGIDRVRLSSLEPKHCSQRLVHLLAENPKVCPHLHLSLQSGSAGVLRRMKRAYTTGEYRAAVRTLRAAMPDIGLTTDIITGFPGETEAEHQESMAFIREMAFSRLHVFPFSPRQGTPAAVMPDQVTRVVKERRSHELIALGEALAGEFHQRFLGRTLTMLAEAEAETEPGWVEGYTANYIRLRLQAGDELRGTLIPVRITGADAEGCVGEMDGLPVGSRRLALRRALELPVLDTAVLLAPPGP